jgi:hypothetical protein
MKQTPKEIKIQSMMEPGAITLSGFLGDDDRHFHAIIEEDENTLSKLNYEVEEITQRMEKLMALAGESFQEPIIVDGHYQVEMELVRGKMICPFMHPGTYTKGLIHLTNLKNNISVKWTPLSVHFIKIHHFFEGKGATFRLDPEKLVKALFE